MANPGDIVYCDFPFVDEEKHKNRTILIVAVPSSKVAWGVMITSKENINVFDDTTYLISKNDTEVELPKESVIKLNTLQTVSLTAISKTYCKVHDECFERVINYLKSILDSTSNF